MGVVTDGEVLAVGEGGGAVGEGEENYFVHNLSVGCLKQNVSMIGLGLFRWGDGGWRAACLSDWVRSISKWRGGRRGRWRAAGSWACIGDLRGRWRVAGKSRVRRRFAGHGG